MPSIPWSYPKKRQQRPDGPAGPALTPRRLSVLVNTIAPYRLPLYAALARKYETTVLHGGYEPNRSWKFNSGSTFASRKVWTMQFRRRKRTGTDSVCDISYVHFNLGLLWEIPRSRPDVLISNELGVRTLLAMLYARLARVPLWVWWGGTVHSERNISRSRRIVRGTLKHTIDRWISYGETSTEYLESLHVPREHILQIQNCVDQARFAETPEQAGDWFADSPSPVLISTGQLIERKGMSRLIEACGRLQAQGREFTLVLVGSGCEYDKLQALATRHGLKHFHILPEQPQPALNQLYRRADAFVFPTLEDVWGLVVNEALWAGCPVLCSSYAGCAREIVPAANIFDPMSSDSFDAALTSVFNGSLVPASASIGALRTHQQVSADLLQALLTDTPTQPEHGTRLAAEPQSQPVCSA